MFGADAHADRLADGAPLAASTDLQRRRLERIEPIHALAGRFVLSCAKGRLNGTVILSPDADSGIQKLTLSAAAP